MTTPAAPGLAKCPTGITGLDEITSGGIPRGRPTLICGGPGCGKTLFAMEFLARGIQRYGEPGVFVSFEERSEELADNVVSLGFDLRKLEKQKKLIVDYVHVDRAEIAETGEYDLEGLFIRLGHSIDSIGAKRVVLDTIETLFGSFDNDGVLRAELRRLFRWLKDRGVTAVITAERGDGSLTRQGLEEYVSDCVILLDHRVNDQVATRRLRVVKYRGTNHGTNEYPFLIDENGVDVLPITSVGLNHEASTDRISTGIGDLDAMLAGRGLYRGSSVLVSGTAGTGKSSLAVTMAKASCERGERVVYFAFEESPQQIARNARSIGIDVEPFVRSGALHFVASRPTTFGLEMHLATIHKAVKQFKPKMVVIDPITNFFSIASENEVKTLLMRLVDFLKMQGITAVFTSLTGGGLALESTTTGVSSIIDAWILLRDIELNGERNRAIYILKCRGLAHSNQVREFLITSKGIRLVEPYLGPEGVLTGSARVAQEALESAAAVERRQAIERKRRDLERKRQSIEAQIAALRAELESEAEAITLAIADAEARDAEMVTTRQALAVSRKASRPLPAAAKLTMKRSRVSR